jgi:tRNA threonylcarbamoyladenosine biosynthesis protein TsaB
MLILAVETSTFTGSVALVEASMEGGLSGPAGYRNHLQISETHSSRLMPTIDRLLRETSCRCKIQGIAVGLGPGSFTGLRIAVSTVKGLGFALRVPVVGVPTLDALANNIRYASTQVCPVLDARKKEVARPSAAMEGVKIRGLPESGTLLRDFGKNRPGG